MKRTGNILAWLGAQEKQDVLARARQHVAETCKTVSFFVDAVKALISGDLQGRVVAIQKVRESEHQADLLCNEMSDELWNDLLLPDREQLLRFVKGLDRIADRTYGCAKILGFIEARLPDTVLKNISASTELIDLAITRLRDAIEAMMRNEVAKAAEHCKEVARFEHEADDQRRLMVEAILHANLDPAHLLLTYQLAEYPEGVTDRIEDAADFLRFQAMRTT
jgi:predicted phosphate transport protein (TIGR00153 family)